MKRLTNIGSFISTPALAALLAVIALGAAGSARAQGEAQVCGPQTLHGSYLFTAQGFTIVSGAAQPKAIVEGIDFNGDGTLSVPFATVSINGLIIQVPPGGVGTYTVETSCQGTISFTNGPSFNIFVARNGKQASMIETDANTVFQGMATRVSR
jgi:hypothetical protein